jgi:ATP-binding cassette subfamily B (MDR/TAP) protein 1
VRYPSSDYRLFNEDGEPESFVDVLNHKDKEKGINVVHDEMNSLKKSDTSELVELSNGKNILESKWVFKLKNGDDNSMEYKAQLVVKGFNQKKGIDFDEIFTPIVKLSSIRIALGLVASINLELE